MNKLSKKQNTLQLKKYKDVKKIKVKYQIIIISLCFLVYLQHMAQNYAH